MSVSYEKLTIITDQRGFILGLLHSENFANQQNAHLVLSLPVLSGQPYPFSRIFGRL
jgi:hypothetical protein